MRRSATAFLILAVAAGGCARITKWEYLFVSCQFSKTAWKPRFENGHEILSWEQGIGLPEYANSKGLDGWELVAYTFQATQTTSSETSTSTTTQIFPGRLDAARRANAVSGSEEESGHGKGRAEGVAQHSGLIHVTFKRPRR